MYVYGAFLVPSQPPTNFAVSVLYSSSIFLSWNAPPIQNQNGLITLYHLNLTSLINGYSIFYTSYNTTIQINGLSAYTTYSCMVAAETSIGRGPYTTVITFTTMEDGMFKLP